MNQNRVWGVSASCSVLVHAAVLGAATAWGGGGAGHSAPLTLRDIRFLVESLSAGPEAGPSFPSAPAAATTPLPARASSSKPAPPASVSPGNRSPGASAAPLAPAAPAFPVPAASPVPVAIDPRLAQAIASLRERRKGEEDLPPVLRFYFERVRRQIADNIRFPPTGPARELRGLVKFQVAIGRNGAIQEMRYLKHSDHPVLDLVAEQAIRRAAPFPNLEGVIDLDALVLNIPIGFGSPEGGGEK